MADNLIESYNPLYDVHLRQYFALPHMQKHLRSLGLLDGKLPAENELQAGHLQMMDMMLRNRERVLAQVMDLQRKLDAAEKVELYRRIRSGITNADELSQSHHISRSLSRPARSAAARLGRDMGEGRRRRQSLSPEAGEMIKRVETDYRSDSAPFKNPKSIYNRLAANVYKYQYLHKLDDRTLHKYMNSLRKQLAKLERFREISFGPHTMARHAPSQLQQSWFFRRRSLPSLDADSAANNHHPSHSQPQANAGRRSLKSGLSRKSRTGKSQSPQRASAFEEPPSKLQRTSVSRTRGTQRLPPLPQSGTSKKAGRVFATQRTTPPIGGKGQGEVPRLPPTAIIRPTRKVQEVPQRRPPPVAKMSAGKKTPVNSLPQKGSTTPIPVQKPPSAGSRILPAIGGALAGSAIGAGVAAAVATMAASGEEEGRKGEENRESGAPSPSISLAASQTTTTDGQPAGDSEWEAEQNAVEDGAEGGTETKPTPEPFLEEKGEEEGPEEIGNEEEGEEDGQHTARPSIHSQVQSPEEEQPPEEPEPPRDYGREGNEGVEAEEPEEADNFYAEKQEEAEEEEEEEPKHWEEAGEAPEEPMATEERVEEPSGGADEEAETYPDEIQSLEKPETPEDVQKGEEGGIGGEEEAKHGVFEASEVVGEGEGGEEMVAEEPSSGRSKREVGFGEVEEMGKQEEEEPRKDYEKQEWSPGEEEANQGETADGRRDDGSSEGRTGAEEEQFGGEFGSPVAPSLDAAESERIRQFSHPNLDQENGPEESVRSLASSSVEGSLQKGEEQPKGEAEGHPNFEEGEEVAGRGEVEGRGEEADQQIQPELMAEEKEFDAPDPEGTIEEGSHHQPEWEQVEEPTENEGTPEEDAGHIPTPVQIEITPSPENRNWEEEEDEALAKKEEEAAAGAGQEIVNLDEDGDKERDINGNDMGVEVVEVEGEQSGGTPPEAQAENARADEAFEEQAKRKEEEEEGHLVLAEGEEEPNYVEPILEHAQPPAEEVDREEAEADLIQGIGGGEQEEMPEMGMAEGNEEFERVKREEDAPLISQMEQEQSADLVESQSVKEEEESSGRKLSGADAQLGLENMAKMEDGGGKEAKEEENEETRESGEMVENAPLEEEEASGPTPEAMDEAGKWENVENVGQYSPVLGEDEPKGSEAVEQSEEGIIIESEPVEESATNYFGKENWTLRGAQAEEEDGSGEALVEQKPVEEEPQMAEEEKEEIHWEEEQGTDEPLIEIEEPAMATDRSHSQDGAISQIRPATAEAVPHQQGNLLSQPSIEITPASEYGGSIEDNRDIISVHSPQPTSPVLKEDEEMGRENAGDGEGNNELREEVREEDQANNVGTPSPVDREEIGQTDLNGLDQGHGQSEEDSNEHQHQNGHQKENGREERAEENEADERTSLLSGGGGAYGMKEVGHGREGGNGQLLMSGDGVNGGSSSETEGADEEGSEGEELVVIHGSDGLGQEQQQHFQSVKLEENDDLGKGEG